MKEEILNILSQSNKLLLDKLEGIQDFTLKGEKNYDIVSLVTEADIESDKLIVNYLRKNFPDDNIYSEEQGLIDNKSNRTWYVDPLDGTSNYLRKIPILGVSIGLTENDVPIFGAISLPQLNKIYTASKGEGAYMNGKRISVSNRKLEQALFYGRGFYNKKFYLDKQIGEKVGLVKILDSSSFELTQIAEGNGEIYSLVCVPHDVVAGVVLISEAGGRVTDFYGEEWNVKSKGIIATNGLVHQQVLELRDKSIYG